MPPVLTERDEKAICNCGRVHKGPVDIRTRRRHRRWDVIVDGPDEPPNLARQGQNQVNIIPNEGLPPGNGLAQPQITVPTIPQEAEDERAHSEQDFYDWPMDVDGGHDGGFPGVEPTQNTREEEVGSDEGDEEDIDDRLLSLTIDFGEESTFEDDSDGEDSLLSDDDLFDDMDDDIPDTMIEDEEESLRLLLQHLKELSGTSHWCFEAKTWQ